MDTDRVMLNPELSYHNPELSYTTQDHFLTIAMILYNREILNLFGHNGMVQARSLSNGRWMGLRLAFDRKNARHGSFCTSNTAYISYKSSENTK